MCRCSTQKQHFHTPTPHQPKLKNLFCVLPDNPLTLQLALRFSNFHTTAHKTPDFQLPNARHPLRKKSLNVFWKFWFFAMSAGKSSNVSMKWIILHLKVKSMWFQWTAKIHFRISIRRLVEAQFSPGSSPYCQEPETDIKFSIIFV